MIVIQHYANANNVVHHTVYVINLLRKPELVHLLSNILCSMIYRMILISHLLNILNYRHDIFLKHFFERYNIQKF